MKGRLSRSNVSTQIPLDYTVLRLESSLLCACARLVYYSGSELEVIDRWFLVFPLGDVVMFVMKIVLFSRRSGVVVGHLGLSERSREITVRMHKVTTS